jgi:hypothetical protein
LPSSKPPCQLALALVTERGKVLDLPNPLKLVNQLPANTVNPVNSFATQPRQAA